MSESKLRVFPRYLQSETSEIAGSSISQEIKTDCWSGSNDKFMSTSDVESSLVIVAQRKDLITSKGYLGKFSAKPRMVMGGSFSHFTRTLNFENPPHLLEAWLGGASLSGDPETDRVIEIAKSQVIQVLGNLGVKNANIHEDWLDENKKIEELVFNPLTGHIDYTYSQVDQ